MQMPKIRFFTSGSFVRRAGYTSAAALVLACGVPSVVQAQSASRFVGSWVEDQSKRTIGSMRNLTFQKSTSGGLEEVRGSYVKPLVQAVHFDGKPYPVDGSRNTIVWKQVDATHFERAISQDNQVINTRRLQTSADGTTLTESTESTVAGKKTNVTIAYRRTSGNGPGLAGVWKPQSYKSDVPDTLRIEAAGSGLHVFTNERSSGHTTLTLTFDGKPSVVEGPTVISGTASAGKLVSDRVIEVAQSRDGAPTGRATWSISQDGKTLTVSTFSADPGAPKEPSVAVYARQ